MAEPNSTLRVDRPQNASALRSKLPSFMDRLPAASRAPSRARHNLDEIVMHISTLYGGAKRVGVGKTARDGNAQRAPRKVESLFAPAEFGAFVANLLEGIRLGILPRN